MSETKNTKLISVIMAAHDSERYIAQSIESILAQTYPRWELLICDDASTDGTYEIASRFAKEDDRITLLRNQSNRGAAATRNRCIESAVGDYIAIQDDDDVSEPDRLEKLMERMEREGCDFVSCGHYLFDESGRYAECLPEEEYPTKGSFLAGMPFCHAATLFTKACLGRVDGYRVSQQTIRNEDYDLFMRLYARGSRGCNISDVLYGYRVDAAALKRRTFRFRIDECRVRASGFKALGILFPLGWLYVLRPMAAHIYQQLKPARQGRGASL